MHRLFFAIVPEPDASAALAREVDRLRRACGGTGWVAAEKFHLTLAFLGDFAQPHEALAERAAAAAAQVDGDAFALQLDHLASFHGTRRPWFLQASPNPALAALAARLRTRLDARAVAYDPRPIVPHLTVRRARDAAPEQALEPPITWTVRGFALMASAPTRPHYDVLARFALRD